MITKCVIKEIAIINYPVVGPAMHVRIIPIVAHFKILSLDDSTATIYYCLQANSEGSCTEGQAVLEILSRKLTTPAPSAIEAAKQTLADICLDPASLGTTTPGDWLLSPCLVNCDNTSNSILVNILLLLLILILLLLLLLLPQPHQVTGFSHHVLLTAIILVIV